MRLIPHDAKFFELFAELSGYLTDGAKLLRNILEDPTDLYMKVEQVQAIEHKGDRATHAIITKLNQSFITPFTTFQKLSYLWKRIGVFSDRILSLRSRASILRDSLFMREIKEAIRMQVY